MISARTLPHPDPSDLLARLTCIPRPAGNADRWNAALRRVGALTMEVGGQALRLSHSTGPGDGSSWWRIRTTRGEFTLGLSGTLLEDVRDELAFETYLDSFLTAFETYLDGPVETIRAIRDQSAACHRHFSAAWGQCQGTLTVGYGPETADLIADLCAVLPFAAAPTRDINVWPVIEIGRCDLPHGAFAAAQVGDVLVPRPEDLSVDIGRLVAGDHAYGSVMLGDGAAVVDQVSSQIMLREDPGEGVTVRLPCRSVSRSRLNELAKGDRLDFAGPGPGRVDLVLGGRIAGSGQLVRLGDRLAVELRHLSQNRVRKKVVSPLVSSGSGKVVATSFEGKDAEGDRMAEAPTSPGRMADMDDMTVEQTE
ncbi:MAG: hypothetical protein AAF264_04560 [Pseudomonadota bacterium]